MAGGFNVVTPTRRSLKYMEVIDMLSYAVISKVGEIITHPLMDKALGNSSVQTAVQNTVANL